MLGTSCAHQCPRHTALTIGKWLCPVGAVGLHLFDDRLGDLIEFVCLFLHVRISYLFLTLMMSCAVPWTL